jgi:hypothetical protein
MRFSDQIVLRSLRVSQPCTVVHRNQGNALGRTPVGADLLKNPRAGLSSKKL